MGKIIHISSLFDKGNNIMDISRLVKKNKLGNLGFGYYVDAPKRLFLETDETASKINRLLDQFSVPPKRVIVSSKTLNFCINQLISSNTYIVEVEKEYLQAVFELLKGKMPNLVLLKPNQKDKENYWKPNIIYVTELFKRSPINKDGSIAIEKLIVDLLFDKEISSLYSGQDIESAIEVLCSKYTINYKTLFAYASRKQRKQQLFNRIYGLIPEEILNNVKQKELRQILHQRTN